MSESWWKPEEEAPPVLFRDEAEVPEGWIFVPGSYDWQRGVWVDPDPLDHDGDGKKGGSPAGKNATARKRK
jgi:hypothetical protein